MKRYYKIISDKKVYFNPPLLVKRTDKRGKEHTMQVLNPTEEMMLSEGWSIEETDTLAEAKSRKIAELMRRDRSYEVNGFQFGNRLLWLNPEERTNYILTLGAIEKKGVETIPFMGKNVSVSVALEALENLSIYAMACYQRTQEHKEAIMQLESIEAVQVYDITTGYPARIVIPVNE